MTGGPIRAVVLDASAARRTRFQELLEASGDVHVVGAVATPEQVVALAQRRQPHVVLAGHAGNTPQLIAWVRHIMQERPLPIVVVSAPGHHPQDQQAFELMAAGAVSLVRDPDPSQEAFADSEMDLLQTLRLMAEVKVVRRWAPARAATPPRALLPPHPAQTVAPRPAQRIELVAIGASTGGPIVLKDVLGALPANFPVPIVVVQHIAEGFVRGLADWLTASCSIRAEVATAGVRLAAGCAYLAPDGVHMRLAGNRMLAFDNAPPVNGHRPAVSCLFESVATHAGRHAIGVLLTGMGRDGAAELKQMREAGAITIAQDQASSVVHGMPGEAIRDGGATYVMTPQEIGAALPALAAR